MGVKNHSLTARAAFGVLVAAIVTIFGANGCLVSFPDYQVGDLSAAGGHAGSGGHTGASGAEASTAGGADSGGTAGAGGIGGADAGDGGPSCTDGITNGDETDMDCGGKTCPQCGIGAAC